MPEVDAAQQPPIGDRPLVLALGILSALPPLTIDAYVPSLPRIVEDLGGRPGSGELTLSSFFAGLSIAQLAWGWLSDRVGRRRPVLAGLALYTVASAACALAPSIELLATARFVQGIGAAASMAILRAVVRDRWSGSEAARVMSLLMLILGAAPIFAPMLGGLLAELASWRGIFVVLVGAGVGGSLLAARTLPDPTSSPRSESLGVVVRELVRDGRFVAGTLAAAGGQAGMFAYIAGSSGVLIGGLGVSPSVYALLFGVNASGLVAVSQLNRWLLLTRAPGGVALVGASVMALAASLLLGFGGVEGVALPVVVAANFVFVSSVGLVNANAVATALERHGARAGLASAVIGTMQFATSAVASALVGLGGGDGSPRAMAIGMLGCALLALAMMARLRLEASGDAITAS